MTGAYLSGSRIRLCHGRPEIQIPDRYRLNLRREAHPSRVSLQAFATSADLALAISIGALTITALRSGRRPQRVRSWLVFAAASVALLAHAVFEAIGAPEL